jgi:rfaE bifunctional protein nucleotidyltransferase chain/domain
MSKQQPRPTSSRKILSPEHAARWVKKIQKSGKTVVMTNGCFDLLHSGHVAYLDEARSLGDALIVALNSDASVRRLKGASRPLVQLKDRCTVIASLECVDAVTWFNSDTPERLIKKIAPKTLVKGGDWTEDKIVGADFVKSYGGTVKSLPYREGKTTSTSKIISKAKNLAL